MDIKAAKAVAAKPVTVPLWSVVALGLALLIGAVSVGIGLAGYNKALAAADARNEVFQARLVQVEKELKANDAQRAQNDQAVATHQMQRSIDRAQTSKKVTAVKNETKPEAIRKNITEYLSATATYDEHTRMVTMPLADANEAIAVRIERDSLKKQLADSEAETALERDSKQRAESDLVKQTQLLVEAQNVIKGYSKVAKKSKWQRIGGFAGKAAVFVGGVLLGNLLK